MEVIALVIFLGFGMEINKNAESIESMESQLLTLQAAHSALHARTRVDHDAHHRKIDQNIEMILGLQSQINDLKE
jgi:hypothetical protein